MEARVELVYSGDRTRTVGPPARMSEYVSDRQGREQCLKLCNWNLQSSLSVRRWTTNWFTSLLMSHDTPAVTGERSSLVSNEETKKLLYLYYYIESRVIEFRGSWDEYGFLGRRFTCESTCEYTVTLSRRVMDYTTVSRSLRRQKAVTNIANSFIYLFTNQCTYKFEKKHNASNVKIRAIGGLQEWSSFTTANSNPQI